jgi:tetratricopeptide (TPR) repeat protein
MGEFNFGYPSDDEIWEKISSDNINSRVEGLLDAARKIGYQESNPRQAINYLETAKELADEVNDFTGLAHCYKLMGAMNARMKNWAECAACHELGADAGKRSFRYDLEVDHLAFAARAYRQLGDVAAVRRNFEMAISLANDTEYWQVFSLQAEYGRFLRKEGDLVSARSILEVAHKADDEFQSALAGSELVTVLLDTGEASGALEIAREIYAAASYNDDNLMRNRAQYGIAKALLALGKNKEALKELDELAGADLIAVKHKVRVDLLRAESYAGLGQVEKSLVIYNKALPMLKRYELWGSLGDAMVHRSMIHMATENPLDAMEDLASAADAYQKDGDEARVCTSQMHLSQAAANLGDWTKVEHYTGLVVSNVLQMFTTWYADALALNALAKAKLGKFEAVGELVSQVFEAEHTSAISIGHAHYAQALAVGGVKGKNLAVKAVKVYLSAGKSNLAAAASELL